MRYEYLIVDLMILFFSNFGFWLYRRPKLAPRIREAAIAVGISSIIYLVMDWFFIGQFYKFNSSYISGLGIGRLPIEEILFFPIVGWGMLLFFVNLKEKFVWKNILLAIGLVVVLLSIVNAWWYTGAVFGFFIIMLILNKGLPIKVTGLTLVLTTIFNWYLTARPIVLYETAVRTGIQIGPIPIEDYVFGIGYVLLVTYIYKRIINL